jgi:hypothetical protein
MSNDNIRKSVDILNIMTSVCSNCKETIKGAGNFKKHKKACLKNFIECGNNQCDTMFKSRKTNRFCSQNCFITAFRRGECEVANRVVSYRTLCFEFHQYKCICCKEDNILDVHHYDNDRENNTPENLIPMCPTHHRYIHNKNFKEEYNNIVENYLKEWRKK